MKVSASKVFASALVCSGMCIAAAAAPVSQQIVDATLGVGSARTSSALAKPAKTRAPAVSGKRVQAANGPAWQEQKVVASDGRTLDQFGWSVAVQGDTALVGAHTCFCVGSAPDRSVYVYTDTAGTWTRTQKISADDAPPDAGYGWSVALDGSTAVVGAVSSGVVYVYTRSGGTWTQTQELVPDDPDAGFFFGAAVAIDGTRILVGSPFQSKTYVYDFDDPSGNWLLSDTLVPVGGSSGDQFGVTVALEASTAIVGAFGGTVGGNTEQGAAYVYEESGGTWTQTQQLLADDGAAGDWFGSAVALQGDTAMVGSLHADTDPPFTDQGATYVFSRSGQTWAQTQKLTVTVPPGGGNLGQSIAIDGTQAVVIARNAVQVGQSFVGAAYVFDNTGGSWTESRQLTASDGTVNDFYGWGFSGVDMQNGVVLVGAYNKTEGGHEQQGAAYFYSRGGGGSNGIITSGPVDHPVAETVSGTSLNIVSSTFDDTGPIDGDWDFNFWSNGGNFAFYTIPTYDTAYLVDADGKASVLHAGDAVGPGSTFSTGPGVAAAAEWLTGADGYVGVRFDCDGRLTFPVPDTVCYGYVHIATASPTGFPATIVDTAFDGDGNSITVVGGTSADRIFANGFDGP
ncbi:MAG TPA: hypothetical protein VFG55_05195 [Rhodanobacteraceae bacterium]|nr:hypothetical protein [Rhodanobacteraceae bacterium]